MADSLLPWHWGLVAVGCFFAAIAALALVSFLCGERTFPLTGKVVVITGGSSGIGKSVAKLALQQGAHVAILARREAILQAAAAELEAHKRSPSQRISTHVVDVSNDAACTATMASVARIHSVIDALVTSAGMSLPREFARTSADDFNAVFAANVLGTRNATMAALKHMTAGSGRIVFVSSQAGQSGIYGYTAYSASKFALNGLAQALQMEVYSRGIRVSVAFPPDTDTPMLAAENLEKPAITRALSEATATLSPDAVAGAIIQGMRNWTPLISLGFDGWLLSTLTCGFSPAGSILTATIQIFFLGLIRLIALVYVQVFYSQVVSLERKARDAAPPGAVSGAHASPLHRPLVEDDQKNK